ncbi:MAG: M18 family aminopeptidase [Cellvibrionaceae bacterium]|nr:M18 family aminopeptidase [Cellvibrionaceae bacterium]
MLSGNDVAFNNGLLNFLDASPTPFHAVATMVEQLEGSGFQRLLEADAWHLQSGSGYYFTRNDSSIIAFYYAPELSLQQGLRMVGAHTDSPALKIKPKPEKFTNGYVQLGVETYGGVLLGPWFDRDLSIAGRVNYRSQNGELSSALINFQRPIATIPSLAIHLNRDANNANKINAQQHLPPLLMHGGEQTFAFSEQLRRQLQRQGVDDCEHILDFDLLLYDTQGASIIGLEAEFIASARLDNLLSCYVGLQALLQSSPDKPALLVCNDHEEVGSASACGAQGPMLDQCLQRLFPDTEQRLRIVDRSMMISADNAHGIHPNYSDKHDKQHAPLLNQGPVIKVNANQRYATTSETSSVFKDICERHQLPVQTFVTRADLACGSTIGPIASAEIGVKTLDVGVPTFAMHSIRELAGVKDSEYLYQALSQFLVS